MTPLTGLLGRSAGRPLNRSLAIPRLHGAGRLGSPRPNATTEQVYGYIQLPLVAMRVGFHGYERTGWNTVYGKSSPGRMQCDNTTAVQRQPGEAFFPLLSLDAIDAHRNSRLCRCSPRRACVSRGVADRAAKVYRCRATDPGILWNVQS
ncbi:hypothetical protein CDEST_06474 [Colletotrichum destructivum]|uniref:Uncharacterized protein n=1 Tax=Colletotrichum destructivum TaxID=34406 RepID=A0AAX4IDH1_9PEZI|nr:hypothetical protein CDEST_06474 [Colletotrichum destructivum]